MKPSNESTELLELRTTIGHVVAFVSFVVVIGYLFLIASGTGHRISIAHEFDGWALLRRLPYGFAESDFIAASFGVAITFVTYSVSRYRKTWAWCVVALSILVFFGAIFGLLFLGQLGDHFAGTLMLLSLPFMLPLAIWGGVAREYFPKPMRRMRAWGLWKTRDRLSDFDRSWDRRWRDPARRYAGFVLMGASISLSTWLIMFFMITSYNLSPLYDYPVTLYTSWGEHDVWVLRSDSAGFIVLSQDDESLVWLAAGEVKRITTTDLAPKAGGHFDRRRSKFEESIWKFWAATILIVLLGFLGMIQYIRKGSAEARKRTERRRRK